MKRIFSILLALTLMLALAVPAFAADPSWNGSAWDPADGDSKDVTASYTTSDDDVTHTYYATITWSVPFFTYNFEGTMYTWQTGTLNYKATGKTGTAGWDAAEKDITLTVTNRSDMAINCSAAALDTP